jgi:uncharacterized protein YlxW (UPF0749 family)
MNGDQRPVEGHDRDRHPETADDVVVRHPFGPGSLEEPPPEPGPEERDERPAAVEEAPSAAEQGTTGPTDEVPAPAEPGETTASDVPGDAAEPAERVEPAPTMEPPAAGEPDGSAAVAEPARRTRDPLAATLIGVLTLLLGFAFAVQVRSVGEDQDYAGAREEDLVRILDDLNAREERLREQIADQRNALEQLTSSDSQSATALEEARARAEAIGILNGTVPAQGPGLVITIRDPDEEVRVSDIVDAIQELRGAGAETMQIDEVRVGVSTAVTGTPGNLMVDGRPITSPYEFVVIGSPPDMQTALNIPGGVAQDLTRQGASIAIEPSEQVVVDALRPLDTPQYASPDTDD